MPLLAEDPTVRGSLVGEVANGAAAASNPYAFARWLHTPECFERWRQALVVVAFRELTALNAMRVVVDHPHLETAAVA